MSRIFIDPDTLKQSEVVVKQSQQSLQKSYNALYKIRNQPITLNRSMHLQLGGLMNRINSLDQRIQHISQYMKEATTQYGSASDSMNSFAHQLNGISNKVIASLSLKDAGSLTNAPSKWKSYFWKTTESEFDHFNLKDGIGKLLSDGASLGGTYGAAIAKATYRNKLKNTDVGLDIAAGTFKLTGRAHANWKKDGRFDPNLSASVGAEAALAHGKVNIDYNNTYFGAGIHANGSVGVASAKAKAVISKKEVTIEGEVGAALAKGECSGKIKIFGITLTATLSGSVGSVGAGANYSSKSNSIEFGGKVAFLFGGGFNFKVDY